MAYPFPNSLEFYAVVEKELSANEIFRPLWLKAYAESNGDEARTRATYVRHRVGQLEAIAWIEAKPEREARRKAKVEEVLKTIVILWGIGTVIGLIVKNL